MDVREPKALSKATLNLPRRQLPVPKTETVTPTWSHVTERFSSLAGLQRHTSLSSSCPPCPSNSLPSIPNKRYLAMSV